LSGSALLAFERKNMPYIPQDRRPVFSKDIDSLVSKIKNEGELNYVMTMLARGYVGAHTYKSYSLLNAVVGVFESAKAEFQRRVVNPYENSKIHQNGDVFSEEMPPGYAR
jgi:hypothetical protein